jgi:hypothetical protein
MLEIRLRFRCPTCSCVSYALDPLPRSRDVLKCWFAGYVGFCVFVFWSTRSVFDVELASELKRIDTILREAEVTVRDICLANWPVGGTDNACTAL